MLQKLEVNGELLTSDVALDVTGLSCPMPLLKTKLELKKMHEGQLLLVVTSDGGSWKDIPAYINQVVHELISAQQKDKNYVFLIRK